MSKLQVKKNEVSDRKLPKLDVSPTLTKKVPTEEMPIKKVDILRRAKEEVAQRQEENMLFINQMIEFIQREFPEKKRIEEVREEPVKKPTKKPPPPKKSEKEMMEEKLVAVINQSVVVKSKLEQSAISLLGGIEKFLGHLKGDDFKTFSFVREKIKALKTDTELKFVKTTISSELLEYLVGICSDRKEKQTLKFFFFKCKLPPNGMEIMSKMVDEEKLSYRCS